MERYRHFKIIYIRLNEIYLLFFFTYFFVESRTSYTRKKNTDSMLLEHSERRLLFFARFEYVASLKKLATSLRLLRIV